MLMKAKLFTLLAVLILGITNVWGDEVTVGFTTATGANGSNTIRSIVEEDHITVTHILNSGTSGALALYANSDKSLYYGSSTAVYTKGGYKWNKNTGTTFNDNYVGFQVDIDDGYKLSLTELELTLAVTANFVCKVEILDDTDVLYASDSWTIANNGKSNTNGINPTFTAVGNPDLQDLTGTFYVRVQLAFSSTGKYLCCPIFTVTGELEETGGGTPVDVTGITLAPSSATIKVGKTVTLVPTITPSGATDKAVTWSVTSGSTYASVTDAGVVTGLAAGTAVITATAHDGSGVTQTATITVEDCPTSGTLFSMNITAAEGTTYTGNNTFPALIEATYVGGQAYSGSKSGTNRTSTIDANGEYPFSANSELAIKVVMDCDLAEGDIIDFTTSSTRQIKIQKVVGTDLYKTASKTFTIPSGSALIGENVFYLMRDNSESTLGSLTVTRPVYRTITLEYADGVTPDGSIDVIDGEAATKPADPTWEHHRFAGWYNGSDPYDWTANVTGDITLTAHWTQLYTITYAAGDGTATGDAPTQEDKAEGETFSVAANTFTVAGKDFVKWNDGTNDYAPGATYTVGTDNVVLTAQWKAAADKYTVIFKDGTTELGTKLFEVGSNPSDAGIDKTKPLNTFAAWQKDAADIALDDASWLSVAKDAEITLTARWTKAFALDIDFEAFIDAQTTSGDWQAELADKFYAISSTTGVTLDAPDGKPADKGLKIKNSGAYVSFNVNAGKLVLLKAGVLSGAEASVDGGANYTALSGASGSAGASVVTPLYNADEAEYRIRTTTGSYNIIQAITITDPFTVSFDANGGDDVASLKGTPSVTLPSATKGTESFLGWFDGETKVGEAGDKYTPTADITLKAHWEAVSTDARLASITFSSDAGTLAPAFDPEVTNYTYTMPYGTTAIPTITGGTAVNANAQTPIISDAAAAWGDAQTIKGVAQSGDKKTYTITMQVAPKDGASIFKAELTSATTATYSGIYADADNSQIKLADDGANGYKFGGTSNFIKMALDGGTFATGDLLTMTYSKDPQQGELAIYENTTKIVGTPFENHTLEFTAGADGLTELFIRRTSDNDFNGWVSVVEVTRVVNPMLTAITFAGEAGTINESLKTVTVTVPNATDLGSMTVVPTIVRNAPHATTPEAVITNGGAWVEGPNTYRIMDKDGDYTDYTVTITRAALSTDATLSSLTVNGQAIALADGVFDYSFELPNGTSSAPTVVATPHHVAAVATVDPCTLSGATITVVPESGVGDQKVYTLTFTISPWKEVVIWDGSYMTEVATSPIADLEWTVNGFGGIANYNATCGTKAYTKCLKSGGAASASRNVELVVPTGYIAKFYIVVGTHEDGTERGMFIGTAVTKTLDASSILEINNSVRTEPSAGTSEIAGAGTWYINPEASVDFYEIRAYLRPGYGRKVSNNIGTLCVDHNVPEGGAQGATFYQIAGKNAEGKLVFAEVTELEAGKPYIFQSTTGGITLYYGATSVANPVEYKGMVGSFSDKHVEITESNKTNIMYIASNKLWDCSDLTPDPGYLDVVANRAYIFNYSGIGSAPAPAPGKRYIVVGKDQATGFDQLDASETPMKVIIDGQLFILRGEKMYNANGQLVK